MEPVMSSYNGKVTIWIGKEDRAKWDAIENKPEWLHEHLSMPKFSKVQLSEKPVPQVPLGTTGFTGNLTIGLGKSLNDPRLTPAEETA